MMSCLSDHPGVFIPTYEINYFSNKYNRGSEWYLEHFEGRSPGQRVGEKSPLYFTNPGVSGRIYEWNPNVKLIFSLRNPIERTYSAYLQALRNGFVTENIEDELTPPSDIVHCGRYFEYLQPYIEQFREEQLRILIFDDLKADPQKFAMDLFEAVGVDPPRSEPSVLNQKFGRRKKRGGRVWSAIRSLSIHLSNSSPFANSVIQWLRRHGYTEWIHHLRSGRDDPSMTNELREELTEYYRNDVEALSTYLDRDLKYWLQ